MWNQEYQEEGGQRSVSEMLRKNGSAMGHEAVKLKERHKNRRIIFNKIHCQSYGRVPKNPRGRV